MRRTWLALSVATAGLILVGTSSMAVADKNSTHADEWQARQIWSNLQMAPAGGNKRRSAAMRKKTIRSASPTSWRKYSAPSRRPPASAARRLAFSGWVRKALAKLESAPATCDEGVGGELERFTFVDAGRNYRRTAEVWEAAAWKVGHARGV